MTPLYTVAQSPWSSRALDGCLAHLAPGASLLLVEDGVAAALAAAPATEMLTALAVEGRLFVLAPDLSARGLADRALLPGVKLVDHGGFVDLCVAHQPIIAW